MTVSAVMALMLEAFGSKVVGHLYVPSPECIPLPALCRNAIRPAPQCEMIPHPALYPETHSVSSLLSGCNPLPMLYARSHSGSLCPNVIRFFCHLPDCCQPLRTSKTINLVKVVFWLGRGFLPGRGVGEIAGPRGRRDGVMRKQDPCHISALYTATRNPTHINN